VVDESNVYMLADLKNSLFRRDDWTVKAMELKVPKHSMRGAD